MLPVGVQVPLGGGGAAQHKCLAVPKGVKWQHMQQDARIQIHGTVNERWHVAFRNGSGSQSIGPLHARVVVWFGDQNSR